MSAYYTMIPADLPALLTAWQSGSRVLCPCKEQDGTTRLESFVPAKGLCLDYTNLAMPPVDVLNGYQDVLFRWEGNERTYVAEPGAEAMAPTVIFGMRPCDVSALEYLDDFYLGEYRDINYSIRREAVTIVGMNCRTPGKSCFCAATGTGPFARSGFDLMLTLDGDLCWVECATDKGESLVGQAMVFFRPVTEAALRARLAELAKSMLAGEWRARSDVAQAVACYLACHPRVAAVRYPGLTSDPDYQRASSTLRCGFGPWVDVCLAGGEKPGWLRLDVTDADAPAWVCRLEELLAER